MRIRLIGNDLMVVDGDIVECDEPLRSKIAHALRAMYPEGRPACPHCGSVAVVSFSSTEERQCGDCRKVIDWKLKPGQAPLVTNNRDKRKCD